ncbi:unnamed protein product [Mucor hiemalis]
MFVKPDSTIYQEDPEDILMSYLNSDYMSTPSTPTWSGINQADPLSPSSTSTYGQSPVSTPDARHSYYDSIPSADAWSQQPTTSSTEEYIQPLMSNFQMMVSNQYPEPLISYCNAQLLYDQFRNNQSQPASPPGSSNSVCSSDSEQTKKRRGRKKREACSTAPTAHLPIAPALPIIKQLPSIRPAQSLDLRRSPVMPLTPYNVEDKFTSNNSPSVITKVCKSLNSVDKGETTQPDSIASSQKAATIAKRQERLIKNRAAALLSRKRKREHLTALEDQRNDLVSENDSLKEQMMELEKANLDLKKKLDLQQNNDSKSVMILMLMIFFFAYFVSGATKLAAVKYLNKNSPNANLPFFSRRTELSHRESPSNFQLSSYNDDDDN